MRVKLLTKEIEKKLANTALYSTDGKPAAEREVVVKFFTPDSSFTWYVVEAQRLPDEDEWEFFGLTDNGSGEAEWGYFTLGQIKEIRGGLSLPVERDRHYSQDEWKRDLKRLGIS